MSLPFERSLALANTRQFLLDLLDPAKTPKVPRQIRKQAYWCLKHYPHLHEIKKMANKVPEILDDSQGYLTKMLEKESE